MLRTDKTSCYTALVGMAIERKTEKTSMSEKDKLAAEAIDRWGDFEEGLASVKRKYPTSQFQAFWSATKRYAELTKADGVMHFGLGFRNLL